MRRPDERRERSAPPERSAQLGATPNRLSPTAPGAAQPSMPTVEVIYRTD